MNININISINMNDRQGGREGGLSKRENISMSDWSGVREQSSLQSIDQQSRVE